MAASILICDDEPSLRELMRIALDGDYDFVEAESARQAIEVVRERTPDLLLLDVMMPGQSGLDVLEVVRSDPELETMPVVVVSAFSSDADRRTALAAGANRFLAKPFDPDDLVSLVEELLQESR